SRQFADSAAKRLETVAHNVGELMLRNARITGLRADSKDVSRFVRKRYEAGFRTFVSGIDRAVVNLWWARHVVAPDALAGELRLQSIAEQDGANLRVNAVGTDDQIEIARAPV